MDFSQFDEAGQVAALTQLVGEALPHWSMEGAQVELITYRENAVFALTSREGERYAMRVHRPDYRSDQHIRSELQWMAALSEVGLSTPDAVPTRSGDSLVTVGAAGVPQPRQCDLFRWVPGSPLGSLEEGVDPEEYLAKRSSVAEGFFTSTAAWELAQKLGVDMPITDHVYHVLHRGRPLRDAVQLLLTRESKESAGIQFAPLA